MKKSSNLFLLGVFMCLSVATWSQHSDHHVGKVEEVIVESSPLGTKESDSAISFSSVEGELLEQSGSANLGDILEFVPGVSSASFGAGVGLPVIRGQSGPRVKVLSSGRSIADVSAVSQDHANGIDPATAERIEVIRGPSTLLYGNGAVGGIVNVITNRVPEQLPEELEGKVEARYNSVNEGKTLVGVTDFSVGDFAWHFDAVLRESDDVDIPGVAILEREEEEEGHEEEEVVEGVIENSDVESTDINFGGSWVTDSGFIGASISYLEKEYGLPAGAHGHEEEHEEGEGEGSLADLEEEEGEEVVRIDLEQVRYELKTEQNLSGFWSKWTAGVVYSEYEHLEVEQELGGHAEEEEEEEEHEPTKFTNDSFELRTTLHHGNEDSKYRGVIGFDLLDGELSAVGEESFFPVTTNETISLFVLEQVDFDSWILETGARIEQVDLSPDSCGESENTLSLGVSSIFKLTDELNLSFGINRSQRAPTTEERYSNIDLDTCEVKTDEEELVVHAATGLIELGNANLKEETSTNFEIGFKKHAGNTHGEINVYFNQIDDYIFLQEVHEEEGGEGEGSGEEEHHDEEPTAEYVQEDAEFVGAEFEWHFPYQLDGGRHIDFEIFGDYVVAELTNGENLPRIPPASFGTSFGFVMENGVIQLTIQEVLEQDDVAEEETTTDGYTLVNLYADYHFDSGSGEWVVFVKGNNLLDEEIRRHTSFVKDFAPEPGIGAEIGLRYNF